MLRNQSRNLPKAEIEASFYLSKRSNLNKWVLQAKTSSNTSSCFIGEVDTVVKLQAQGSDGGNREWEGKKPTIIFFLDKTIFSNKTQSSKNILC